MMLSRTGWDRNPPLGRGQTGEGRRAPWGCAAGAPYRGTASPPPPPWYTRRKPHPGAHLLRTATPPPLARPFHVRLVRANPAPVSCPPPQPPKLAGLSTCTLEPSKEREGCCKQQQKKRDHIDSPPSHTDLQQHLHSHHQTRTHTHTRACARAHTHAPGCHHQPSSEAVGAGGGLFGRFFGSGRWGHTHTHTQELSQLYAIR